MEQSLVALPLQIHVSKKCIVQVLTSISRTFGFVRSSHAIDKRFFSPPDSPRFIMSPMTRKKDIHQLYISADHSDLSLSSPLLGKQVDEISDQCNILVC